MVYWHSTRQALPTAEECTDQYENRQIKDQKMLQKATLLAFHGFLRCSKFMINNLHSFDPLFEATQDRVVGNGHTEMVYIKLRPFSFFFNLDFLHCIHAVSLFINPWKCQVPPPTQLYPFSHGPIQLGFETTCLASLFCFMPASHSQIRRPDCAPMLSARQW